MATYRDNPYGAFNFLVALGGAQGSGQEGTIIGGFSDVSGLKAALEALGHPVTIVEKVAGGMNGVLVDENGWLHGAACWRADGVPIGISGGQSRASTESGVPR